MLEQIARVMFWLCVGDIAAKSGLPLPAPVTGLILLYAELAVRGRLPDDLGILADRVLQFLGMLFVPAGVGVIAYLDLLKAEAVPILAAVIGGTAITLRCPRVSRGGQPKVQKLAGADWLKAQAAATRSRNS